ncbi:MAG: SO_0444 family Cu/Zn efflux transporter [Gammaproteobacteria bacterium]
MTLFLNNLLDLALDAAPWLLLGLVIGGLIKSLMPTRLLERHLKGAGVIPVVKAAIIGAPLPLCSCGVVPAALGLRRAGASKSSTVSFLVSTPETGVDSISVTWAMLGPVMAIVRPVAAVVSAIAAGLLVGGRKAQEATGSDAAHCGSETDCCVPPPPAVKLEMAPSCCSMDATESPCCNSQSSTSSDRDWISGIRYAFTDLLGGILFWLVVGLLFSAAVQTWLPSDFLARWGSGLPAMLVMIAVSIPMYVCATASTPIAAGLLMAGISPGTVLVFLLAGPASNIGSMGIIRKELGQRALTAYLAGVAVTAIASGLLLDWFVQLNGIGIQSELAASEHLVPHWLAWASLLLLVLATLNLLRDRKSGAHGNETAISQ